MYYTDSMEYKVENIYHSKTKEYFNEVFSSYNNENFRSAIVMLYSVVICDLIYKLQELSDRYSDEAAKEILKSIEEEQNKNSVSSKWETTLIEQVKQRTSLFESKDKLNLDYLRDQRHLAAHPVLDQLDILVKPNKETVRACMVNMLDGLLCKTPLLSKKMTTVFLEDIVSVKNQFIKDIDFERYLESKYFSKINKPTTEKLFKDLWKFTFRLNDEKTKDNRKVIYRALVFLYKKDVSFFNSKIEADKSYYSQIFLDDETILNYIMQFLSVYPKVYQCFDQSTKVLFESNSDKSLEVFIKGVFLSDTLEEHLDLVESKMMDESIVMVPRLSDSARGLLFYLSKEHGVLDRFLNFLIKLLGASPNYNDSDLNFQDYILSYGDLFDKEQYVKILEAINKNNQLSDRGRAKTDNSNLKKLIESKFEDQIDYSDYPNFQV